LKKELGHTTIRSWIVRLRNFSAFGSDWASNWRVRNSSNRLIGSRFNQSNQCTPVEPRMPQCRRHGNDADASNG
jgi:hypothetical protein